MCRCCAVDSGTDVGLCDTIKLILDDRLGFIEQLYGKCSAVFDEVNYVPQCKPEYIGVW